MAQALFYRDLAKNFTRRSTAWGRLAKRQDQASKDLPQNNAATDEELRAAIAMADLAEKSFHVAAGLDAQATIYHELADAAWNGGVPPSIAGEAP